MSEVTRILNAIEHGDGKAADELLPLVYGELRKLAAFRMSNEAPGQTLQPTALVHEAWLRLTGDENVKWDSQAHFFGAAAEAMRRILIDSARRKRAARHGGGQQRTNIQDADLAEKALEDELIEVHEALDRFAVHDPKKAELVKLRYFGGFTFEEAANVLKISEPTAKRWWSYARVWLFDRIKASKV